MSREPAGGLARFRFRFCRANFVRASRSRKAAVRLGWRPAADLTTCLKKHVRRALCLRTTSTARTEDLQWTKTRGAAGRRISAPRLITSPRRWRWCSRTGRHAARRLTGQAHATAGPRSADVEVAVRAMQARHDEVAAQRDRAEVTTSAEGRTRDAPARHLPGEARPGVLRGHRRAVRPSPTGGSPPDGALDRQSPRRQRPAPALGQHTPSDGRVARSTADRRPQRPVLNRRARHRTGAGARTRR